MAADESKVSFYCERDRHDDCAHRVGSVVALFGKPGALLCTCSCHAPCPLDGETQVADQVWLEACTCAGGVAVRENQLRMTAVRETQRARRKEVMRSIDLGRGRSAAEIERMIVGAYVERGWEPPSDFAWVSRFMAAGTARHGRRTRLLIETARGLNAAKKFFSELRDPDESEDDG
jgi:hypothetical protein